VRAPAKPPLCAQCLTGWVPDTEKRFSAKCPGCLDKKARGLRTGLEPAPQWQPSLRRERVSPVAYAARATRARKVAKAKRKLYGELPECRG
jgi:hypothetical protein